MVQRFDPNLLDPDDPFEIDDQIAHLAKHETFAADDVYDVFYSDPLYYPAKGPADWLMVAEVPGGDILVVPLAASEETWKKARPIGVYRASQSLTLQYLADRSK